MSNPGGLNLNISPYYDDYDEDKKFARVLYRPGYAVQARELTQSQSIQQKQIQRFADYFFNKGAIIEGCEQTLDLNVSYVKVQSTYINELTSSTITVNNEDFNGYEIVGSETGVKAYVGLSSDLEGSDPKTLYLNYLSSGSVKIRITDASFPVGSFGVGNNVTFYDFSGGTAILTASLVAWDIDPTNTAVAADNQYIWINNLSEDWSQIPTSGTPVIKVTFSGGTSQEMEYLTTLTESVTVNGNQLTGSNKITLADASNLVVGAYITGTGIASDTYITDISGFVITLSKNHTGVADSEVLVANTSDLRHVKVFNDGELLFKSEYNSRVYAQALATNSINYTDDNNVTYTKGSKFTLGGGVIYIADHFIKVSEQTILLDKYSNIPSYKVGLVPTKTFIDSVDDTSLLDNAQGYPNFQAPGADRLKLDVTLTKVAYDEVSSEPEFVSLLEVENGIVKKRKSEAFEGKIEDAVAKRTSEESGDYTLSDPKVIVREHLNSGTNGGRYSLAEGGDSDLLLLEIDPFTAYIKGYRNELITKGELSITKGLDTEEVEQVNTQIVLGSYIPVDELIGFWDFEQNSEIDLYDTAQNVITNRIFDGSTFAPTGTKIGTARIKTLEYYSGEPGSSSAIFNLYIYNIQMLSGNNFKNVRSLFQNKTASQGADCVADVVLDSSGNASLKESAFDKLVFQLPYTNIKTIRDASDNIESGFRFKREFTITLTGGNATIGADDSSETFVGSGTLSETQINNNYMLIPKTTALTNVAIESAVSCTNASQNVSAGTAFTSNFIAGDFVSIDSVIYKITQVTDANNLVLDAPFASGTGNYDIYKAFPAGLPVRLNGTGTGLGLRTVVGGPSSVTINIQENVTLQNANFIATMDRSNAREIRKTLVRDREIVINSSTHPNLDSGPYSLGHSDIYRISGIYQSADFVTAPTTGDTNVTSSFTLDKGQTDNSYENGSITPNLGTTITGKLLVVFDYFEHDTTQGIGYLSVDSYPVDDSVSNVGGSTIYTTDIPKYTSNLTGEILDLRNCLDFRPIKQNVADGTENPTSQTDYNVPANGGGLHIPSSNSDFSADLIFYKPRKIKLYISSKGELGVINGAPGYPNPADPPSLAGTLDLAEITVPAYPSLPKDTLVYPIQNKRFTMKDIGKLQERVDNIEYYTALNLLEKESRDKIIIDSEGLDKFKNGILVDAFTGHSVADVSSSDYNASISRIYKYCSAYRDSSNQLALMFNSVSSTGHQKTKGNKVLIEHVEQTFIDQPYASEAINLAQDLTYSWVGDMKVYPSTDNWLQTTRNVELDLTSDLTPQSDNWRKLSNAWNTEISPLERNWIGVQLPKLSFGSSSDISRITTSRSWEEQIGNTNVDISQKKINYALGRAVDISISHKMRTRDFIFESHGLLDGTQMYAFFDGIDVTLNCTQIKLVGNTTIEDLYDLFDNDGVLATDLSKYTVEPAGQLRSNNNKIYGIFTVPTNTFDVGEKEFKLIDDPENRDSIASTVSKYSISATGLSLTRGSTSLNTRPFSFAFDERNYVQSISRVSSTSSNYTTTNYKRFDPIAQSFYIDESTYPEGIFVTSLDLFFKEKSSNSNLGVVVEIREMLNGFPTKKIIGNETARVENADIQTNANSLTATTFTFPSPIYLLPGNEYCFTVKPDGNTNDFTIWTSVLGATDITDTSLNLIIDKEPATGVLFTPSNEVSWSVRQNQDIKFKMKLADFNTATPAVVYLGNEAFLSQTEFSRLIPNIEELSIANTGIEYEIKLTDLTDQSSGYVSLKNLTRSKFSKKYKVLAADDLTIKATLTTSNRYISPYIDLERVNVAIESVEINNATQTALTGSLSTIQDSNVVSGSGTSFDTELEAGDYIKVGDEIRQVSNISSPTALTTINNFLTEQTLVSAYKDSEEFPVGPYASSSRYISRRVVLNDGFESSSLHVYLDVNRPAGTDIKVYYKILNEGDNESFDVKFYHEMELVGSPQISDNENTYVEEQYVIPDTNLTGGAQILYGTVSTSSGSPTVNGTDTRFTEELKIGDTIAIGPDELTGVVLSITNNTTLTLDSNFGATLTDVDVYKVLNNVVSYTTVGGTTFNGFKTFAIKVVFTSSNDAYTPKIKNLRTIAVS